MTVQIDSLIERILDIRTKISVLEHEAEELRVERSVLENSLMEQMANMGVSQLGSSMGTASMKKALKFGIGDWDSVLGYVIETDSFDLLQKRISTKAVADRLNAGEEVPGITIVEVFTVSIRKK